MQKLEMREFVAQIETRVDGALKKWKKIARIEDSEVVQLEWQFEKARILLDIFWNDGDERINLECRCARVHSEYQWSGLRETTITKVMDRVGNFAQIVQDPRRK